MLVHASQLISYSGQNTARVVYILKVSSLLTVTQRDFK